MNKEKLGKLEIYAKQVKERLNSPVPPKHAHRPDTYKAYLTKELETTNQKIDSIKLQMPSGK